MDGTSEREDWEQMRPQPATRELCEVTARLLRSQETVGKAGPFPETDTWHLQLLGPQMGELREDTDSGRPAEYFKIPSPKDVPSRGCPSTPLQ